MLAHLGNMLWFDYDNHPLVVWLVPRKNILVEIFFCHGIDEATICIFLNTCDAANLKVATRAGRIEDGERNAWLSHEIAILLTTFRQTEEDMVSIPAKPNWIVLRFALWSDCSNSNHGRRLQQI